MFSIDHFLRTFTYIGVAGIIFAESGLLVGIILPGDSLLFAAGLLASQHVMNIYVLLPIVIIAAIAGDMTGYGIGKQFGPILFTKSKFLSEKELAKAEKFFKAHGGKSVVIGRFVPVVRTVVPVLAGISKMKWGWFNLYNVTGAILWGGSVTLLGYFLGSRIPNIDKFIMPIIAIAVLITLIPTAWHYMRVRREQKS